MTSAFGKVILLGEHAVVYGHPSVAGAINRGVTAHAVPLPAQPSTLQIADWDLRERADDESTVAVALSAILASMQVPGAMAITAEGRSRLPVNAGSAMFNARGPRGRARGNE